LCAKVAKVLQYIGLQDLFAGSCVSLSVHDHVAKLPTLELSNHKEPQCVCFYIMNWLLMCNLLLVSCNFVRLLKEKARNKIYGSLCRRRAPNGSLLAFQMTSRPFMQSSWHSERRKGLIWQPLCST
jgi:hypothetical protein